MTPPGAAGAQSWLLQGLSTVLALLLVLALAWLVLRAVKRMQAAAGNVAGPPLQIQQSTSLGPRERLVVVHYRGRDYLLGVGAAGISLIDRWSTSAAEPPAD